MSVHANVEAAGSEAGTAAAEGGAAEVVRNPARVAAVRATGLLDAAAEEVFDRLPRLAVRLLGVPAAFLSLVDAERDFHLSACGFGEPLASAREFTGPTFCHYALASPGPLVIPDTAADPAYRDVPTVHTLGVAAYVGVPVAVNGHRVGSFCAVDTRAHAWSVLEVETMTALAAAAERELELRSQRSDVAATNRRLEAQRAELAASAQQLREQQVELEARAEALHEANANLSAALADAVRARHAAEAARAEAERARGRLARVVAQLPTAVGVLEGPEHVFAAASDAYARMAGGRPLVGRRDADVFPELVEQGFIALLDRVYATGDPLSGTDVPVRWDADGDGVPEDHLVDFTYQPLRTEDGRVEGIVFEVTDVTARARLARAERDARAAAEESAARLAAVLDALPDAAAVYDADWRYTFVNPAARALHAELLGGADGAADTGGVGGVLGRVAWEVFPWLVGTRFETESRRAMAEGRPVEYVDHVPALGRWYETRVIPTAAGAVSLNRDVTAQRSAQAERDRLLAAERAAREAAERERARAAEANRVKAEFLATMSHELRTPLNAIQGYAQLLDMGVHGPVTSEQRAALARLQAAQTRLLGLVNDVLNYAKLEGGRVEYDMRAVDIADVVRDVAPLVAPQVRARGLALEVRLPEADGRPASYVVWADREKLGQVLLNLLSNAVKFTPPPNPAAGSPGRIRVSVASRDDADTGGPLAFLRVEDTGIGIPRDKQDAIFEPFVQVRARGDGPTGSYASATEGTGLGLAISRDLTRGMGGDLRVRSAEGAGAVFTVTLRRVVDATGQPTDRRVADERRSADDRRDPGADHAAWEAAVRIPPALDRALARAVLAAVGAEPAAADVGDGGLPPAVAEAVRRVVHVLTGQGADAETVALALDDAFAALLAGHRHDVARGRVRILAAGARQLASGAPHLRQGS